MLPSIAYGMPSAPKTVSSGARKRSSDGVTIAIYSGGVPASTSARISSPTSSRVALVPAASRKRTAPSSGDDFVGPVLEERPLEVRERRMSDVGERGRKLGRGPIREASEIGGRALERGERGPSGLVRQRDVHLGATCERLEQAPLGTGQVFEPVGVHRLAVPGLEIAREPLDRPPPDEPSIPAAEPVELGAVGGCKAPQIAAQRVRLEQVPVELVERRRERVREAGEPCGASEPVQRCERDDAANEQRALRDTDQRPTSPSA